MPLSCGRARATGPPLPRPPEVLGFLSPPGLAGMGWCRAVTRSASAPRVQGPAATSAEWWRQAVVYQICPRRFAGSGAEGVGDLPGVDLRGVISRIPYLAALGIDAIWLGP